MKQMSVIEIFKERHDYPILPMQKIDPMIEKILESDEDNYYAILMFNYVKLMSYQKVREQISEKYFINAIFAMPNIYNNFSNMPMFIFHFSKHACPNIKIAKYSHNIIEKSVRIPDEVNRIFDDYKKGISRESEYDIEVFKSIPFPKYTQEFTQFLEKTAKWANEGIRPNSDEKYNIFEVSREKFDPLNPDIEMYTNEALTFFENLYNEDIIEMQDVARIIRAVKYNNKDSLINTYKCFTGGNLQYPICYNNLPKKEAVGEHTLLQKNDILVNSIGTSYHYILLKDEIPDDVRASNGIMIIRPTGISPEYLFLYLQSEQAKRYLGYVNYTIQLVPSVMNKIPIIKPCEEMVLQAEKTFINLFMPEKVDRVNVINDMLRQNKIVSDEKPFQTLLEDELIDNLKLFKADLITDLLKSDAEELKKCFEVEAYKACLIICGSILETVLLDWLSEKECTDYFVNDEDMQISLCKVINRIKYLQKPKWQKVADEAHDIRLKRNLVHPVKFILEKPVIDKELCLHVVQETDNVLKSRGLKANIVPTLM